MIRLWEHQSLNGDRLLKGEMAALFWKMRCGKTLTAIHGSRDGDRLIICPNAVKPVWARDLALYGDHPDTTWVYGMGRKPASRPRNVVINYESVWRNPDLLTGEWDTVIFDESHRVANMRTKLWEGIQGALPVLHKNRVILLSGTPCPEGSHQVITQAILATGEFDGHPDPWAALREGWTYNEYKYQWEANYGTDQKAKKILNSFGMYMSQEQAGIHTKKLKRVIEVPISKKEEQIWHTNFKPTMEPTQKAQLAQSVASGRDPVLGYTVLSSKLDAVIEYVIDLGASCVILAHFLSTVDYLSRKLDELGIVHGTVSGEDGGMVQRAKVLESFEKGTYKVLVATVPTVKVGVNLSVASCLVFAENNWSGEARIQAEERCTVVGKEAVEIIDFQATSSVKQVNKIDGRISKAVQGKQDFQAGMLED